METLPFLPPLELAKVRVRREESKMDIHKNTGGERTQEQHSFGERLITAHQSN